MIGSPSRWISGYFVLLVYMYLIYRLSKSALYRFMLKLQRRLTIYLHAGLTQKPVNNQVGSIATAEVAWYRACGEYEQRSLFEWAIESYRRRRETSHLVPDAVETTGRVLGRRRPTNALVTRPIQRTTCIVRPPVNDDVYSFYTMALIGRKSVVQESSIHKTTADALKQPHRKTPTADYDELLTTNWQRHCRLLRTLFDNILPTFDMHFIH